MNSFFYNSYQYSFFDDNQVEVQVGNGSDTIRHNACEICPKKVQIPAYSFDNLMKKYKVTRVSKHAFSQCEGAIESVFIPKTIQIIDECSFLSIFPTSFIFEAGSQLREIGSYGIGWIRTTTIILPPSVEILSENSLRGFHKVEHLYYCGTYNFDDINVFTTSETRTINTKIHVTKRFNSNYFGNILVYDHNLNCNIPFSCTCKIGKQTIKVNLYIICYLFFLL